LIKHKCHGGDFIGADHGMRAQAAQDRARAQRAQADVEKIEPARVDTRDGVYGPNGYMSGAAQDGSFAAAVHAEQASWQNRPAGELRETPSYWERIKGIATSADTPVSEKFSMAWGDTKSTVAQSNTLQPKNGSYPKESARKRSTGVG
jgi:hypothetical protein